MMNARLSTLVSDQAIEICDDNIRQRSPTKKKVPWKQSRSLLDSNEDEEARDDSSKQSVDMEKIELSISEIASFDDEPRDEFMLSREGCDAATSEDNHEQQHRKSSITTVSSSDDSAATPVTSGAGGCRSASSTSFESLFSVAEGVIDVVCRATACDSRSSHFLQGCDSMGGNSSRHGNTKVLRSSSETDLLPLHSTIAACAGSHQGGLSLLPMGVTQDDSFSDLQKTVFQNRISCRTRGSKHLREMYRQWHSELTPNVQTPKRKAIRTDVNDVSKSWDETAVEGYRTNKTDRMTSFFLQQTESIADTSSFSNELFYDSEPETILHGSKAKMTRKKTAYEKKQDQIQQTPRARLNLRDDELVKKWIQQLRRSSVDLLYHPPPLENGASSTPISVMGWFEMGSRLSNKLIQPKFMWRPKFEPNADRRRLGGYSQSPHNVDLLGLVKILKPKAIDRKHYPFARTKRTFTLLSQTDEWFVFEARTEEECDKFVDGLKLLVARLASMVIVGDEAIIREFFSPWCHAEDLDVAAKRIEQDDNCDSQGDTIIGSTFVSTNDQQRDALWGTAAWN